MWANAPAGTSPSRSCSFLYPSLLPVCLPVHLSSLVVCLSFLCGRQDRSCHSRSRHGMLTTSFTAHNGPSSGFLATPTSRERWSLKTTPCNPHPSRLCGWRMDQRSLFSFLTFSLLSQYLPSGVSAPIRHGWYCGW